jgi:phosphoheptose isomerase
MKFDKDIYFDLIAKLASEFKLSPSYGKVIEILLETLETGGTVFTMGCGGSASTATHFASDLAKTTLTQYSKRFKAISLVDNIPLVSAWTNDSGWNSIFIGQLEAWLTDKDVLVGFSVHGGNDIWSGNLTDAMKLAETRGAKIIGFSGFDGGAMRKMADACLTIPVPNDTYGTPLVEAMHVVLTHAIIFDLKERMKRE